MLGIRLDPVVGTAIDQEGSEGVMAFLSGGAVGDFFGLESVRGSRWVCGQLSCEQGRD